MLVVIGNEHCSRCEMTKSILNSKNIEYQYWLLNDLPQDLQDKYMGMAQEKGMMNMPLIIKDDELISLQEVG